MIQGKKLKCFSLKEGKCNCTADLRRVDMARHWPGNPKVPLLTDGPNYKLGFLFPGSVLNMEVLVRYLYMGQDVFPLLQ